MKWSLKLGSFAGIRVYLPWTFALLLGWILFAPLVKVMIGVRRGVASDSSSHSWMRVAA